MKCIRAVTLAALVVLFSLPPGVAMASNTKQVQAAEPTQNSDNLEEIQRQLENPLTSLWSLTLQENLRLNRGDLLDGTEISNVPFFQTVMPVSLGANWILVTRPVFPLVTNLDPILAVLIPISLALPALAQPVTMDVGTLDRESAENAFQKPPYSPYAGRHFPTRPFFGDTHLHIAFSMDAGAFGARLGPKDAHRLAKGEESRAPSGQLVKLSRRLDFLVAADHSDNMGFAGATMSLGFRAMLLFVGMT